MAVKNIMDVILPKKRAKPDGASVTGTYSTSGEPSPPTYRGHLKDLPASRLNQTTPTMMVDLFKLDPDVSASVNAYLTVADTNITLIARDSLHEASPEGTKILNDIAYRIGEQFDYSQGFQLRRSLRTIAEELRYMTLLRGANCAELILDKQLLPSDIRVVDPQTLTWREAKPGQYKPWQTQGSGAEVSLDYPTVSVNFFRRNPNEIYSESFFVSAINTVAARTQVINDLYRVMQVTGFPRIELTVIEEALRKNAPPAVKANPPQYKAWVDAQMNIIAQAFGNTRPDQVYAHSDAIKTGIVNERSSAVTLQIEEVVATLNAQNQAALKVVSSVIGRANSSVNASSTETVVFGMNAQQLNNPVKETLEHLLTLALRLNGFEGYAEVIFEEVNLRPSLELEPQRTMKQSRLMECLSRGIITDTEFHLWMFGRLPPANAPQLSGTNFMDAGNIIDTSDISSNSDPLGRALTGEGADTVRSNTVQN